MPFSFVVKALRLKKLYESWEDNSDIGFVMMKVTTDLYFGIPLIFYSVLPSSFFGASCLRKTEILSFEFINHVGQWKSILCWRGCCQPVSAAKRRSVIAFFFFFLFLKRIILACEVD